MKHYTIINIIILSVSIFKTGSTQELDQHKRQLLEARLEHLFKSHQTAARLDTILAEHIGGNSLTVELLSSQQRTYAQTSLTKNTIKITGRPQSIKMWLEKVHLAGLAITPPINSTTKDKKNVLEINLWQFEKNKTKLGFDSKAGDQDLTMLRDNLVWLDKQKDRFEFLLGIINSWSDLETITISAASLKDGRLTITGQTIDDTSRQTFISGIKSQAAKYSDKLKYDFQNLLPPDKPKKLGYGLQMQDADPWDLILLASSLKQQPVVMASTELPSLSGQIQTQNNQDLLKQLLGKLAIPSRYLDNTLVVSKQLASKPTNTKMFSSRSIDYYFRQAPAKTVLATLAELSRKQLLIPLELKAKLSMTTYQSTISQVAAAVLMALGLTTNHHGNLLTLLPEKTKTDRQTDNKLSPKVDINSRQAPLSYLVAALSNLDKVVPCRTDDPLLSFKLKKVSSMALAETLLLAKNKSLVISGKHGLTVERDNPPTSAQQEACLQSIPKKIDDQESRLKALYKTQDQSLALLLDGNSLRWVKRNDMLADGRIVRNISLKRVRLKDQQGKRTTLEFTSEALPICPGPDCGAGRACPQIPLAHLRLAATAVTPKNTAALLIDKESGQSYLVRPGQMVGRRCSKIIQILPGKVRLQLDCPTPMDPTSVELMINPVQ
jgi:hypothetical protein